jgi:hypothetical protein
VVCTLFGERSKFCIGVIERNHVANIGRDTYSVNENTELRNTIAQAFEPLKAR